MEAAARKYLARVEKAAVRKQRMKDNSSCKKSGRKKVPAPGDNNSGVPRTLFMSPHLRCYSYLDIRRFQDRYEKEQSSV